MQYRYYLFAFRWCCCKRNRITSFVQSCISNHTAQVRIAEKFSRVILFSAVKLYDLCKAGCNTLCKCNLNRFCIRCNGACCDGNSLFLRKCRSCRKRNCRNCHNKCNKQTEYSFTDAAVNCFHFPPPFSSDFYIVSCG